MDNKPLFLESNDSINKFIKLSYRSLRSSQRVPLERLEDVYKGMESALYDKNLSKEVDFKALKYVLLRLPECIFDSKTILVGQSESILEEAGYNLTSWTSVYAKARRRRCLFDGKNTLLVLISSKSDLDDVIPSLLLLQIEWKKIKKIAEENGIIVVDEKDATKTLSKLLSWSEKEEKEFSSCFKNPNHVAAMLLTVSPNLLLKNHEASFCRYRRETETWWEHIVESYKDVERRPLYFVSSNSHSLINLVSGFAEEKEKEILSYAEKSEELKKSVAKYKKLESDSREKRNLLYYFLMKYESSSPLGEEMIRERLEWEKDVGILRISSDKSLDVPTQIIDLKKLKEKNKGKKTGVSLLSLPDNTEALILNIDYPLGRTAYFILTKIAEHAKRIEGVYVIGKAASLFAERGDLLIPSTIFDQHTGNQYFFKNAIKASNVSPYLENEEIGLYDNQKAVTVLGTILQNKKMFDSFLSAGVTELEMEAGPYLAAVYEMMYPKRFPENEQVNLQNDSFELGIIHYVSDNPLGSKKLDSSLALDGIDATYASTEAVMERIFSNI